MWCVAGQSKCEPRDVPSELIGNADTNQLGQRGTDDPTVWSQAEDTIGSWSFSAHTFAQSQGFRHEGIMVVFLLWNFFFCIWHGVKQWWHGCINFKIQIGNQYSLIHFHRNNSHSFHSIHLKLVLKSEKKKLSHCHRCTTDRCTNESTMKMFLRTACILRKKLYPDTKVV